MRARSYILPLHAPGREGLNYGWLLPPYVTDLPADLSSPEAKALQAQLHHFPDEAVYVYHLEKRQLIYVNGFRELLGYADAELTMGRILSLTTPRFASFMHDIQQKAVHFIRAGHAAVEEYCFIIEMKKYHRQGHEVPLLVRLSVHEAAQGIAQSIIGRLQLAPQLRFGQVVRYAVCGPDDNLLEATLSQTLFLQPAISDKEREALALVAGGAAFKEIAHQLGISHSAVEKRILPLYKRFGVRSLPHLISYAYDHGILP